MAVYAYPGENSIILLSQHHSNMHWIHMSMM